MTASTTMDEQTIRYRVLGPIELNAANGDVVRLARAQERSVLAALLLEPGRVVGAARLVDVVWGESPPPTATALLHAHISRIRAALGVAGLPTIGHVAGAGYRLDADPHQVDLWRFTDLAERAADASDDVANALYDRALALWRGEPFGGAAGDVLAQRIAPGLLDQRASAEESALAIRLRRHGPASVLAAVSTLHSAHPVRESTAVLLMNTLHAAGRTDEALEVFRDLRRKLVDTLGIEPSAETQRAHAALLDGGVDDGAQQRTAPCVPAQLPRALPRLAGRSDLIAQMSEDLTADAPAPPVIVVAGAPGNGKTALAVHVADLVRGHFEDGQLFVHLAGASDASVDVADALGGFLRAMGVSGEELADLPESERSSLFRSMLATRRMLVVLDDARDAAQVRPLLPARAGCAVVVTSRSALPELECSRHVELQPLDRQAGEAMLASEVGARRLEADSGALRVVLDACAGVPLALHVVAGRLRSRPSWSVADLAARLVAHGRTLDELVIGDLAVRSSLRRSYRLLDPVAARVFRLLALSSSDMEIHRVAAMTTYGESQVVNAIDRLADLHLVTSPSSGRVGFHDLVREYAKECLLGQEHESDRRKALEVLVRGYADDLRDAACVLTPGPGRRPQAAASRFASRQEASRWIESEFRAIAGAIGSAAEVGAWTSPRLSGCLRWLAKLCDPYAHAEELVALADTVSARCVADGDRHSQGVAAAASGGALLRVNGYRRAIGPIRESLELLAGSADVAEATALNHLAIACDGLGRAAERRECLRRSYEVYRTLGDLRGQAIAAINLCDHYAKVGLCSRAMDIGRHAIDLTDEIDAPDLAPIAMINTADAARGLGLFSEAERLLDDALAAAQTDRAEAKAGEALLGLGRLSRERGDTPRAVSNYERAITAFRGAGARHEEQMAVRERAELRL